MKYLIWQIAEANARKRHGQVTRVYFSREGWYKFIKDLDPALDTASRPLPRIPFYGAELFIVNDDRHPDYVVA